MRLVVVNHMSLDGVAQSPARPDEDRRGGFPHGGWGIPYQDEVLARAMAAHMAGAGPSGALLLGRVTYEDFYAVWPKRTNNPYTEHLNKTRKYVASRTLEEPLPWVNSVLLRGDAVEAVRRLAREQPDLQLCVLGSLDLVHSLASADLVDEYVLTIAPLVLGRGARLFPDAGTLARLELVDATTTPKGVIMARYRRA